MLRRILPTVVDTKYNIILAHERSLAKAVAAQVIQAKSISVWEITFPFIFLYNLLRFKRARELFTLNFLFTKKLALEAARDMIKNGRKKPEVMAPIEEKTDNLLASDKKGIYSYKIRQKQLKEIDLLIDHYLNLLKAEGKDYPSLIKNAYQTRQDYLSFLQQLKGAEREVNQAALQTLGRTKNASEITSTMEKAANRIRLAEAEKIFA